MKRVAMCTMLVTSALAGTALAQWGPGWGWGGGYHHASTAEEGAARGMADVIRSAGAANLMNSEAAKNYQDAQKKYIENRLQATDTYFEMRRINKESRQAERGPAPTQEQLVRFSQARMPDRLGQSQLDPLTGAIRWPIVLRAEPFAAYRKQLEAIYADRAKNGYLSPDQYLQVKQLSSAMLATLQQQATNFPSSQTIEGRKFIEGLSFEANMDPASS